MTSIEGDTQARESSAGKAMRFAKNVAMFMLGGALLGFFCFVGSETIRTVPGNALVFVDKDTKTYFSPPLIATDLREFCVPIPYSRVRVDGIPPASAEVEEMTRIKEPQPDDLVYVDLKQEVFSIFPPKGAIIVVPMKRGEAADAQGYTPDSDHADRGGFMDRPRGWSGFVMEKVGLRKPRWTETGDWNW